MTVVPEWDRALRLRDGVHLVTDRNGGRHLLRWPLSIDLPNEEGVVRLVRALADPEAANRPAEAEFAPLVEHLNSHGWLDMTVTRNGRPVYRVEPVTATQLGLPRGADVPDRPRLSRHTTVRPLDGFLVMESARSDYRVHLYDPTLALAVAQLAGPSEGPPSPDGFVGDLARAGMLARDDDDDGGMSPHELAFHERSNLTTGPAVTRPAPPARRRYPGSDRVPLPIPDLDQIAEADPPLTEVLESRASLREHDARTPITLGEIGQVLYRTARIRHTHHMDGTELRSRPYPSSGSLHELEFHLVAGNVDGLPPGLYHYDPYEHDLVCAAPSGVLTRRILTVASASALMSGLPQALVVMTSRMDRVTWKYRDMAYSLVLRNVGVAMQTLYLVSTAMGLAPCAVGASDRAAFAQLAGFDAVREPVVGEFLIGSRPPHGGESRS